MAKVLEFQLQQSVLPVNTQDWSPLGWTGWISLQSKGLSRVLQHHSSKASILHYSAFFIVQLSHPYMTTGKTIALTRQTFVDKVVSLLFNMLYRLVITFLPRSKRLLISWRQSPSAVILEPRKIKSATVSTVSPSICYGVMGPDAMILVFWIAVIIRILCVCVCVCVCLILVCYLSSTFFIFAIYSLCWFINVFRERAVKWKEHWLWNQINLNFNLSIIIYKLSVLGQSHLSSLDLFSHL